MKYLILLSFMVLSFKSFSYEMPLKTIDLNEKEKFLVELLNQPEGSLGFKKIKLLRTSNTPNKVSLRFELKRNADVCVREGYVRQHTSSDRYDRNHNQRFNGAYDFQKTCIEWERQFIGYNKKIVLNFKEARKLQKNEQELIKLTISQYDLDSTDVTLDAEMLTEKDADYQIEIVDRGLFRTQGLKFIK